MAASFKVGDWFTQSYYVQYTVDQSMRWANGVTVRVGVRNLEDRDPPLASTNVGYEPQIENPVGRYWYGTITKRF